MDTGIRILGMGVVSSIGLNVEESLASLRSRRCGISPVELLQTAHRSRLKAGEIKLSNMQLMDLLGIPEKEYREYTRTSLLGMLAAREAFESAGIDPADGISTALVSATTVGGMDKSEQMYQGGQEDYSYVGTHPCGDSTDKIAAFLGIGHYRSTLSTACSSGANAIIHGARLIRNGFCERVIAGGVDALSAFTLNGFNSLMILDPDLCRPFDRSRKGLNLGEGAGYLILGSAYSSPDTEVCCGLSGYANSNDAFHQTASSPDGEAAYQAMKGALGMAGILPAEIDYINVHGTGTENNDASEGAAMKRLFGDELPAFSSTKSFTGHTLGAAAGIEAVFSVLALREGLIFPSLGFSEPMEELGICPEVRLLEDQPLRYVLSNSFGFGGNNSSLLFKKSGI